MAAVPRDWGTYAIELQQRDPDSTVHLVARTLQLRRQLWDEGILTAGDGGSWRVDIGNLLICERNPEFFVAVAGAR
jgi:alpha-glucosidase